MDIKDIHNVFFVGAGGIGMSALARYFKKLGKNVYGFDSTPSVLTGELLDEGIKIHYDDSVDNIPEEILGIKGREKSIIVFTPAVRDNNTELNYFRNKGYRIFKRAEILGLITKNKKGLAVAGTHGKTTVSTCLAHILNNTKTGCSAFLGGVSKNYNSNLLFSEESELVVVEADEFDRSFLHLNPYMALITSIDPDHLDIYGNFKNLVESFKNFTGKIKNGGTLIIKNNLLKFDELPEGIKLYSYSLKGPSDFYADNITLVEGMYNYDLITPDGRINKLCHKLPGLINVENAVAASAMAYLAGTDADEIRIALKGFEGIRRRFDVRFNNSDFVYIDDYAHHPEEIKALLLSVRELYPGKTITAVFQPHLYSRTKDFADEFAISLDGFDRLLLLDLYPAREDPVPGVSSEIIFNRMKMSNKSMCQMEDVTGIIKKDPPCVLVTMGAGNIAKLAEQLEKLYEDLK